MEQKYYSPLEFDNREKDVIIIWQNGEDESNAILVERDKVEELITQLKQLNNITDMNKLKVVKVTSEEIEFENGVKLSSNHDSDCCESHELNIKDLTLEDFKGLEFDLTNDNFFKRIPDYGIELIPINGHSVKIAGHGYNNGYYSDQLDLILADGKGFYKQFDISECQVIEG